MRHLIIIIIFSISISTLSQKEGNIWYFGEYAGLDFNDVSPVSLTNSAMDQAEGCSSISDNLGNLLFYTDGVSVWNKNHVQMENGSGLLGHNSSSQSAIIVKKPGLNSLYYIFTTDAAHNDLLNGFNYSIIDISLNGGLGSVIQKNNLLFNPVSEKVTAIYHSNQTDIWIITHEWGNSNFRAYLLTEIGLNTIENSVPGYPVLSTSGSSHSGSIWNAIGYMKASLPGNKIGLAIHNSKYEVFDFNKPTGIIYNAVTITTTVQYKQYGIEFSPDESKLYVTKTELPAAIYQFNLDDKNEDQLAYLVAQSNTNDYSALQLGPDGKIYVANYFGDYLSVINNPNTSGSNCDFEEEGIFLDGKQSLRGLPNILPQATILTINHINECFGDTTFFSISWNIIPDSVFWNFDDPATGENNTSDEFNPFHIFSAPGSYNVKLVNYYGINTNTIFHQVTIDETPELFLGNDTTFCSNDNYILDAGGGFLEYLWQDSSTNQTFTTDTSGLFWVLVEDENGCQSMDTIFVDYYPQTSIDLGIDSSLCSGDFLFLDPGLGFITYLWQDGSTNQTFYAGETGIYWVEITDINNCNATDTINLQFFQPLIDLGNDTAICAGTEIGLFVSGLFNSYLWQDNSSEPSIIADTTGIYWCMVTDSLGCEGSDTVLLDLVHLPLIDLGHNLQICFGDTTILSFDTNQVYNYFHWSDGSLDSTLTITEGGIYWLSATNSCGETSDSIEVEVLKLPKLFLGNDTIIKNNSGLLLDAGSGFETYLWNDGSDNQTLTIIEEGIYWVNVFDGSCKNSDTIIIEPIDCDLFIPNVFTPNNDGYNDYFFADASEDIFDFELQIYNRWGERIWETSSKEEKWDGKRNGNPAAEGVYFWTLVYDCVGYGGQIERKGTVTLLR